MVEVSLTVGKLDASLALLLTKDHHLIEFPTILLPNGVRAGSIVKIKCDQDLEGEKEEQKEFQTIQDEILTTFGTNLPSAPNLKIKNVTQTSCVLEWDTLELGTANLKNLVLFKDGKKLGAIPQPLTSKTTKLSGLSIDQTFEFQLRLDTTAGIYLSAVVEVTTHKMTDLSGITVCLGDISANEQFTVEDIENTLKNMGANYPPQDKIKVDTTHYICTRENKQNPEFLKAFDMNIPIIRPEWLKACERERRIVGVRDFYVKDCVLPDILAKNYWQKGTQSTARATESNETEPKAEQLDENEAPTVVVDEADVNKEEERNEQSVGTSDLPDTEEGTKGTESLETVDTANDQLEEVKIDDSTNNVNADEQVDSETQKEEQTTNDPEDVNADVVEPSVESATKAEEPEEETKPEAIEPSEVSPPTEEKEEDNSKIDTKDTVDESNENEPMMDEIKLEDKETQINDEPNAESKETETEASEKIEPTEKEESVEPGNTETEGEGEGEGENEAVGREDSNNASTSTNKKKKKNNKKKNKKKQNIS
ncbi:unnamed protein product [Debaryomyces tyrocola]|nr:unnamed protein product [Debaryomyces tyrocola]